MNWETVTVIVLFFAIFIVGAGDIYYQLYKMVVIDAKARGLKHPTIWGLFSISGRGTTGFLMYIIGRRNHPIVNMSENDKQEIARQKKAAGIGVIFMGVGALGIVLSIYFMR
ncbi:MAG: hypothetical protein PHS82_04715 [Lachnospiraceae bacterium]|nr:hypothetical protein [Lachnospiraceae bacterium]